MGIKENKEVVRKVIDELYSKGNFSVAEELVSQEYSYTHPLGVEYRGPQGLVQFLTMMHNAFPDRKITVNELVGEGERIVARVTFSGTLKGKYFELSPTGKYVTLPEAMFYSLKDGKITKQEAYTDGYSFLTQTGIIEPLG